MAGGASSVTGGADRLAPLGVGQAEHDDVEHDDGWHIASSTTRVDLEATGVDDVVGAAVDDEQPLVVEVAEVVGAEPPHAVGVAVNASALSPGSPR